MEWYIILTLVLGLVAEMLCTKSKFPHHSDKYVIRIPGSVKDKNPEGTLMPELTVKASNYFSEYCFKTYEVRSDNKCVGRTVTIHMMEDGEDGRVPVDTCSTAVAAMVRVSCGVTDVTDAWDPLVEYNRENNVLTYHLEGHHCLKALFKYDPKTKQAKEKVIGEQEKCPKEPSSSLDGAVEKEESSSSSESKRNPVKTSHPVRKTEGSGTRTNQQKSTQTGTARRKVSEANNKEPNKKPITGQSTANLKTDGGKKIEPKVNPTRTAQATTADHIKDGDKKMESKTNPTHTASANARFSADDQFQ